MKKKEVYWFIGTIALILVLNLVVYGINGFKSEAVIDINIHDTYYVISNLHFTVLTAVFICFLVYSIRSLREHFKNLSANLILILSTILLIVVLNGIGSMVDSFIQQDSGWAIYPPLSATNLEQSPGNTAGKHGSLLTIIFISKIVLLVFLPYFGFKTGQHFKTEA
ncbi:hypothetical protein [uncultured Psychroserpens sp.]|uniref:hypothetical protein n=1 Tax=uncultured Psychroserpens sp. TaxID=255436 RepID=UPI0026036905|nr:hypothetical protein [uncultured Psychroserpens sp.]